MFEYLRFRRSLWELERRRRQASAEDEYDESIYADEVSSLHTRYLWEEANRLIIPTPPPADMTAWDGRTDDLRLTLKGINDLRAAIRVEKKLRREEVLMWMPAIAALTGLAVASSGLMVTGCG